MDELRKWLLGLACSVLGMIALTVAFAFFTADTAKPGGMTPTLKSDASATAIQDFRNTIGRSPSVTSANDAGDRGKQAHLSREAATPSIVKRQQTPSDGDYLRGAGIAAFGSTVKRQETPSVVTGGATFVPLFNGRDLSGWRIDGPHDAWKVEGGVIVGSRGDYVLDLDRATLHRLHFTIRVPAR